MIERWALISGLKGDLETYSLIQKNLKKIQGDINLFVLGDMVGAVRNCDALIDRLITHGTQPEFTYRHEWAVGDMVLWDNRSALHRGLTFDDQREKRRLHRTTIAGSGPTL